MMEFSTFVRIFESNNIYNVLIKAVYGTNLHNHLARQLLQFPLTVSRNSQQIM